jgi:hypothetical protein
MLLAEGTIVGHYRLIEQLGEGGMGVVWRAEDVTLGRHAALKFLPTSLSRDAAARERMLVEARSASQLDHPNICTVYEVGETEEGGIFIAMACYDGPSLKGRLGEGPLPPETARDLVAQIARGLAAAHARGIVHRDVKPSNIVVTDEGVAKLLDFGVAKVEGVALTRTGTSLGTLEYMAPEQARGQADARSDVWALGAVLFEMLTGQRPFRGAYDGAVLFEILHGAPDLAALERAGVPPPLAEVVRRCLQKDPDERYPSADALARALEAAKGAGVEAAADAPPADRPPAPPLPGPPVAPALLPTPAPEPAPPPAVPVATPGDRPPEEGAAGGRRLRIPLYVPAAMGALLVVALGALLLASDDPAGAVFDVDTSPPGAAVYLDGRLVGMTPLRGFDVSPGQAAVALRLDGFAAVDTLLQFEAGARPSLVLRLAPAGGGTQAEAVEATAEGDAAPTATEADAVRPGTEPPRPPETIPPPSPGASPEPRTGTIVLSVHPRGTATVAGQSGGTVAVPPGRHTVTFRHPTYGSHQATVTVAPGETKTLACYFEATVRVGARLDGGGQAPSAAVTVDGQNRGFTPTSLTLGPGTYRVAVSRTGFASLDGVQTVSVAPSLEPVTRSLSFRLAPD